MASTDELRAAKLFDLKEHVCVVTGGGTGIGLMASQALAANGAKVYISGRRAEVLDKASKWHDPRGNGAIIAAPTCDVTKKDDLQALVDHVSSKEGHVDLLVASAGISGPKAEPKDTDASDLKKRLWSSESFEEWNDTLQTDVTAVYFTTVAFLPLLQAAARKRGAFHPSVIVISSISGVMREAQGHFSYNAAKGGTVHLTKLMSKEFQKVDVRVNSIAPGYFPSEMTAGESGEDQKSHIADEEIKKKGHVPAGRSGADHDMAMAVLLLAKNTYVNGEILAVDGGVLNEVSGR